MKDRLLIATKDHNFEQCLALAKTHGLGLEIQSFAFPPFLNTDNPKSWIEKYEKVLKDFPNEIAMHGAFMDMAPGSPDPCFLEMTTKRTQEALDIAERINAKTIVFHVNFIIMIHNDMYREGWTQRVIEFYKKFVKQAEEKGIHIVLENMWEFDPLIIGYVLKQLNSPSIKACLDVGHTQLFSGLKLEDWLNDLEGQVAHIHINNNYGDDDEHLGLDDGIMEYEKIIPVLREIPDRPAIVLEIEEFEDIKRSLSFFKL